MNLWAKYIQYTIAANELEAQILVGAKEIRQNSIPLFSCQAFVVSLHFTSDWFTSSLVVMHKFLINSYSHFSVRLGTIHWFLPKTAAMCVQLATGVPYQTAAPYSVAPDRFVIPS